MIRTGLFKKKKISKSYDRENTKPVIKASICNGEQVAGFKDIYTGKIEEVMLIKSPSDIDIFKKMYGIDEEIAKEY
ncbi:aspartate dehydrogenase [Lachnospiraceae bacterium MD308]|nr:aspartate dehydrogenase [Lachnospiraceae bacterium MD308]